MATERWKVLGPWSPGSSGRVGRRRGPDGARPTAPGLIDDACSGEAGAEAVEAVGRDAGRASSSPQAAVPAIRRHAAAQVIGPRGVHLMIMMLSFRSRSLGPAQSLEMASVKGGGGLRSPDWRVERQTVRAEDSSVSRGARWVGGCVDLDLGAACHV